MEDIGFVETIQEVMKANDISVEELSERCGWPTITTERILRKNIPLRLDMAVRIAVGLGVSIDAICGILAPKK